MQYCKHCGRQLKDGMRFCDRCGMSVRKTKESGQAARHQEIKELQEERLNRKKRLAEKEEKQQRARENRRKNSAARVVVYIIAFILIAILSIKFGEILGGSDKNKGNEETKSDTNALPAATEAAQQPEVVISSDEYAEITVANVRCPYPTSFQSGSTTGNEKMSLTDPLGGAKMTISQDALESVASTENTNSEENLLHELARKYHRQIGASEEVKPLRNDEENSYTVTAEINGTVYHRKCVVRNRLAVYYDFEYSASSGSAPTYQRYIEDIDARFK